MFCEAFDEMSWRTKVLKNSEYFVQPKFTSMRMRHVKGVFFAENVP